VRNGGKNVGAPTFKVLLEDLFNSYQTFEWICGCVEGQAVSFRDSKAYFPKMNDKFERGGCYQDVMKFPKKKIPLQDPSTKRRNLGTRRPAEGLSSPHPGLS